MKAMKAMKNQTLDSIKQFAIEALRLAYGYCCVAVGDHIAVLNSGNDPEDVRVKIWDATVPPTVVQVESHAAFLYDTYCRAVGGVAHDGALLPDWKTFRADPSKQKQSDAWIRVGLDSIESR